MKIKLGKKMGDTIGMNIAPKEEYFPSFHIEEHPSAEKIPDKGSAKIKFKVIDRHIHERDEDGKKVKGCSVTIEVISFEVDGKKDKPKGNSDARSAFDEWAKEEDGD